MSKTATHKAHVLVVGSYATGLVMETQRLPAKGETVIGSRFRAGHGGKGSNQAVQAARLGADVAFIACVGKDAYGDAFDALLRAEHVRRDGIRRHPGLPTGVGFIIVDAEGHNLIAVDLGANNALCPDDLNTQHALFKHADVVVAQFEIPLDTALTAMRIAKECNAITVLNPAPAQDLSSCDLSCVDYFTPNETETLVCAGMPNGSLEAAMHRLRALGCRNVVTTTGAAGCLWLKDGPVTPMPGFRATVVDTVGAGDSFSAALAVGLGEKMEPAGAIRFAHAAASLSVTVPDTIPSYHRRADVDARLNGRTAAPPAQP